MEATRLRVKVYFCILSNGCKINEINIGEDKKINENKLDNYGSSKIKCEKLIKKYQKKYRGSYYSLSLVE